MRKEQKFLGVKTGFLGEASQSAFSKLSDEERNQVDRLIGQMISRVDAKLVRDRTVAILEGKAQVPSGKVPFGRESAKEVLAAVGKRMLELESEGKRPF